MQIASTADAAASYQAPEIQAIDKATMDDFLSTGVLSPYRIYLDKLLRYRPHILSEPEERLLAMQQEANQTARNAFSALTDVDMDFGEVETPEGKRPLTQASFSSLLLHPDRDVRKRAYDQFMGNFDDHKNTLANLYIGSIQLDVYRAKARNFSSARAASLFGDKVSESVYDSLIDAVHRNFDALHRYYDLRKRVLGVDAIRLYDTKVPLVSEIKVEHSFDEAVDVVAEALSPLGDEYVETLTNGLRGGWVDRYENRGKRSGAFSAGSFVGDPYILMNFQRDVLRDVFTLAHEGGHSMHSWYSARNNPFQHYSYTIFEAETASTFNEQLLQKHMYENASDDRMRAYLVNKQIDDIIGTLYRQTMFAEYERNLHQMVEEGKPLSLDAMRAEYRKLLEAYFGPNVPLEEVSDLEGLRIPHFYRAFYVYKYATGISAAITLAKRVMEGGGAELESYLNFLKSGGSKYPIESLRTAGVDMEKPVPVDTALRYFSRQVELLENLVR
jgi:oligoendopeptidase F